MHEGNRFHQNLYHVESVGDSGITQHPQPLFGAADDAILLFERDSVVWWTKCVRSTSFYFDEYQCRGTAITANQVDFTAPFGAKIPVQYAVAISAEVICGNSLSLPTQSEVSGSTAPPELLLPASSENENRSEQPAQTTADELGTDRGSEVSRCAPVFHNLCSGETHRAGTRCAIFASYGPE
jgi:hypothetical protein